MRDSLSASRMTQSRVSDPNACGLRLWLLSANTIHGVTYYRIVGRFTSTGQTWEVSHRYSEFLKLRDKLVKFLATSMDKCPGCCNYLHAIQRFDFPKKHLFASRAPPVVHYRVKALRSFLNLLASWAFSKTPKCPTCGGYAFEVVRNFVLDGNHAGSADANMTSIRESMTVKAFAEPNVASVRASMQTRNHRFMSSESVGDLDLTQSMYVPKQGKQARPSEGLALGGALAPQASQQETPSLKQSKGTQKLQQQASNEHQRLQQRRWDPDEDPYDVFNDYLPTKQSKGRKVMQASMEEKMQSGKFMSRPLDESIEEGKLRRQQETEARGSRETLRKHRSVPRNLSARRVLAESDLSVDTSAFERPLSKQNVAKHTSDEVQHHEVPDSENRTSSSVCSDEDELELTGVTMGSSPHGTAKRGVDNLWQPWELARVA
ncbi:hypothetical protein PsorP6_006661 [Peronosclerospora sorghi]|uniref:Uncharacterized protein n=1 Tax=Peronosclerospora sorghi TaxID=230839 RepID=A0ACC0W461_9STRA|nr:hypothetical protein PsorP6_006661 [Peronosclerospora sorghi]